MKRSPDPRSFSLRFRHFAWTVRLLFSRGRPDNDLYGISVKTADGRDLYLLSRKRPVDYPARSAPSIVPNASATTPPSTEPKASKPLPTADYWLARRAEGLTPEQVREAAKSYPRIVPVNSPTKPPSTQSKSPDHPQQGKRMNINWARRYAYAFAGIIALACAVSVSGGIWYAVTPHNYADCLLKNLRGSKSSQQVFLIRDACRAKFPFNDPPWLR